MNDDDDGSDQDIGVDGLDGDTTSDEEWDPAQEQAYVQDARNVVTLKRAVLAANLSRLQGVSAPHGGDAASSADWSAAVAQLQQAAKEEEAAGPLDGAGEDLVAAITGAAQAVSVYCGGRAAPSEAEVELAARAKTAAGLIGVAAAGLPRREAATDAPPARKGRTQKCSGCGEPGHKVTSCKAPAGAGPAAAAAAAAATAAAAVPAAAAAAASKCRDCLGGGHSSGDAACPVQRHCGGAPAAYDRGVDPDCKDPLQSTGRQTRACTVPVGVLARAVFGDDKDDADTRAAVETALQAELEDLSGAATKLRFLMLRVLDVALRRLVSTVADAAADDADWTGAVPANWAPVWLWLACACGCEGVSGSPLQTGTMCAGCGKGRANTRMARARSVVTTSHPLLAEALSYALTQVMAVTAAACDRYLPASNNTARWEPVATIVATHAGWCVDAACRKLGAKAAKDALATPPAATAAPAGGSAWDTERRLTRWAAACFRAGTADRATPGRRGLDGVPQHLVQALAQRVAVMRAAMPPSVAGLFPATPVKKRRWWAYVPFLLHVLNVGVGSPYALIPGARTMLHGHGTLVPDKMLALLRAVSAATGVGVRGHPSLRAWPELRTGGAAVLAAMAGVGGRANRAASQLSTDGVAVTFFLSRPDTAAEAEARAVAWAKKLDGGGRARDRGGKGFASRAGVLTQLERAGLPLARVRWLQMVGGDPGRSAVLSAAPGERVATADLPARPAVAAMRASWSRHMGLDALNRAAVALLRGAGVQDGVAAAATVPDGHPPGGSRKRAAAGAPAAGAGTGGGRSKRQARRSSPDGSHDDAAAVAPAAAGATTPPEARTYQTASPGGGHGRVRRGPQASIRRARRTQLATSVRRVLRRTRLSRWTVPRHEAEKVARWLVDRTAAAGNSASGTTPDAPLLDRVDALPRRKGCRRLAPVPGLRYSLSAAHFREASGGNFLARAWKQWRARSGTAAGPVAVAVAVAGLVAAAAGDGGGVAGHLPPVDLAAAHGTMRTGDDSKHLHATLEWAARRDTAAYGQRFGAQATRHLQAARVRKAIQRGRFAASVARDLTGGLLRQVRGGGAVVVAMGTARVRGGDAWLRRHLRRLC
ncbi:hypothetical protein I4F81_002529 [Pyropia yezoensis]|uniref:Uncharacterized protein n=1 Tax=Pyropia yezoensis TaxID=2788 RepID=A0ACC3BPX5_PYRYE|nr:hypothetical protein I4F81_002529 [Neopyropia yezoensis]